MMLPMTLTEALAILNHDTPVWVEAGARIENSVTHELISHERAVELAEKERERDE
jgi:hypothetical protein